MYRQSLQTDSETRTETDRQTDRRRLWQRQRDRDRDGETETETETEQGQTDRLLICIVAVAVAYHVISCRDRAISGAFVERKGYSHVLPTVLVRACALHLLVRPLFPRGGHGQGSGASPCLVMLAFAC